MMFRGALARLAAQYFVLLVLILGCFDLIVYVTVSQALQAKAAAPDAAGSTDR